jgi:hypothetical protein
MTALPLEGEEGAGALRAISRLGKEMGAVELLCARRRLGREKGAALDGSIAREEKGSHQWQADTASARAWPPEVGEEDAEVGCRDWRNKVVTSWSS